MESTRTGEVGYDGPPGSPPDPPRTRDLLGDLARRLLRRYPGGPRVLAVLLLVLALAGAGWWWTHAPALGAYGNATGITRSAEDVGRPFHYGQLHTVRSAETVHLVDVAPRVDVDTADARVRVRVCANPPGGDTLGTGSGPLSRYCDEVRPAAGRIRLHPDHREYLVLTVTATQPGRVVVSGLDVTYRRDLAHLFQRGTDPVGIHSTLRITR